MTKRINDVIKVYRPPMKYGHSLRDLDTKNRPLKTDEGASLSDPGEGGRKGGSRKGIQGKCNNSRTCKRKQVSM